MKAQPLTLRNGEYIECPASRALFVRIKLPVSFSPLQERILPVQTSGMREGTPNCWTWNGDTEKPTLSPSILTRWAGGGIFATELVCHSFVNDGMVQFLSDCTHELAGQTVPLLDID